MKVTKIVSEMLGQNTYIVSSEDRAILIDCGVESDKIEEMLKMQESNTTLDAIFLTHSHFDHIMSLDEVFAKYGCEIFVHSSALDLAHKGKDNLTDVFKIKCRKNIKTFEDGDEFKFGEIVVKCIHTPGHSRDSSCFVIDDNLFTGDTIFRRDVGRTDLYGGDPRVQMISFQKMKIYIPEEIQFCYPGHGMSFDRSELDYNLKNILGE